MDDAEVARFLVSMDSDSGGGYRQEPLLGETSVKVKRKRRRTSATSGERLPNATRACNACRRRRVVDRETADAAS